MIAVMARLKSTPRERRGELRSAAWGLAVVPGLMLIGFLYLVLTGSTTIHLFLPLLAPQVPLSIGYSLFRHNILETRAVLTRRMLWIPIATTAGAGAILLWLGCHALLRSYDLRVYIPWAAGALVFALLAAFGFRFTNRVFFSVRARVSSRHSAAGRRSDVEPRGDGDRPRRRGGDPALAADRGRARRAHRRSAPHRPTARRRTASA